MFRLFLAGWLVAVSASLVAAQVFTEDWDDMAGAARWSAPIVALENPALSFDGGVDYAFDYSVIGAPSAPNSSASTTIGVAMETNTTEDGDVNEGESVGIVPLAGADMPTGDFRLTADLYIFWNDLTGSTEYSTFGVYSNGTAVPLRFPDGTHNGDGLAWQHDSDGDSGTDIIGFLNPPGTQVSFGEYEDIPDGSIPNVNTGTASPLGPANQWVEMEIESIDSMVSVKMNGYVFGDPFPNTGPDELSGGTILIGGSDPFNSVNVDDGNGNSNVVVWDNIVLLDLSVGPDGDFDDNGDWECSDVDSLVDEIVQVAGGASPNLDFDLTGDSNVTDADLTAWLAEAGPERGFPGPILPGDANLDGTVDGPDFLIWNTNKFSSGNLWCGGDFNADGTTDGPDFLVWNTNKFQSSDVSAVPEPATAALLLICSFVLTLMRRRTLMS